MKIIKSISVGVQKTFSPEMKSEHHNYIHNNIVHKNSHAVSYCLMAFRCLWLKAHFAPEFWASVMSGCHPDKLVRYMSVARAEEWHPTDITYLCKKPKTNTRGVKFGTLNINNLTTSYTVTDDIVNQGLIGIKKIGDKAAETFAGRGEWSNIDEFVQGDGRKNKTILERFIKLGAFSSLPGHNNSLALWKWYQYQYCSNVSDVKKEVYDKLLARDGWNEKTINEERQRQINEYKRQFPNRRKIPPKFNNWMPKPDDSRESVMSLYKEDFTQAEKLEFQKEFLGFYLDSPLELFTIRGGCTIKDAKTACINGANDAQIEVMVVDQQFAKTKPTNGRPGTEYLKLFVTDGIQRTVVFIWNNELANQDPESLVEGAGIRMRVRYDKQRNTFSMCNNSNIISLRRQDN